MKNIAVFIDGTGQDRSKQELSDVTNVGRLHDACKGLSSAGVFQKVKYCNGVGTGVHERFSGGAFGIGLDKRIIEGYLFLQQEVGLARAKNEPYKIFIFGFSRGAFAARWLAEVIEFSGIPLMGKSERPGIMNLWNRDSENARKLRECGDQYDANVEMIGVWDTVQTTLTSDFGVKTIPVNAASAFHAMALDEFRVKFQVTRFAADNRVQEVWFDGCHADVGGGYENGRKTADAALVWMADRAREHGLLIDCDKLDLGRQKEERPEIHDELAGRGCLCFVWRFTNWIRRIKRNVRPVLAGDILHDTVQVWKQKYAINHLQNLDSCRIWGDLGIDRIGTLYGLG